jgi:DNA topoisomerase-1
MYLILVESPSKCKKIESFLKEDYSKSKVMATCGHFREVESIQKDFSIQFKVIDSKIKSISSFLYQNRPEIILATDNDREGEAIAWHICDYFDLDILETKRILFNEITKTAILQAMKNPTRLNMPLVEAQMARVVSDRWIGYKFTPSLWNEFSQFKNVSAGRCQTPTLRLVDEREELILKNPLELWIQVEFVDKEKTTLSLNKNFNKEEEIVEFLEQSKSWEHTITKKDKKVATRNAPPPFCTSKLQQHCSSEFQWSPTQTMKVAQSLYEKGCITYHRTESTTISKDFQNKAKQWITEKYGESFVKQASKEKKEKECPHECIRPTTVEKKEVTLDALEKKLYHCVWLRTIQSLMSACSLDIVSFQLNSPQFPTAYYEKTFEVPTFLGYRILQENNKEKETNLKETWQVGSIVFYDKIFAKEVVKKKIMHYNEGQLVKLLDEKKIGRPSTFSSFVQKIQDRQYVQKRNYESPALEFHNWTLKKDNIQTKKIIDKISEKQKLILEEKGKQICAFLYKEFDLFFNYEYTAKMEAQLDLIAEGKMQKDVFLLELEKKLEEYKLPPKNKTFSNRGKFKNQAQNNGEKPIYELRKINADLVIKPGKNGWSDYVFDKKTKKCHSLQAFPFDYLECPDEHLIRFVSHFSK